MQEGGTVQNFTNVKYEDYKLEITKKENPEAFRKSTRSEPEYNGSSIDDVDETGQRIKGEDKAKIKQEQDLGIQECILQKRSSAESSKESINLNRQSFKGAKINVLVRDKTTPEKTQKRLSSDKIAAVFKIKDTTPFEKKMTKAERKRKLKQKEE